jgi:drug/metabolite transporter (DMT)-like permease
VLRVAAGVAAACAASSLYDLAVALQALEARAVGLEHSLRPSLLARLLQRPRWIGATALAVLGWPLQLLALGLIPLTVVQPTLAAGLLLLLYVATRILGEHPRPRDIVAVVAIVAGVAGLALVAPDHASSHAGPLALAVGLGLLGVLAVGPYLARGEERRASLLVVLGAGCAYAWTGISSKLVTDDLATQAWGSATAWAVATGGVACLGLLGEMSALQRRTATQVAPVVFVVQVVIPVLLAPLLGGESWGSTPLAAAAVLACLGVVAAGAAVLTSSGPIAAVVASSVHEGPEPDHSEPLAAQVGDH